MVTKYHSLDQRGQNMKLTQCPSILLSFFKNCHLIGGQTLNRYIQADM